MWELVTPQLTGEADRVLVLETRDELRRHLDGVRGAGRSVGLVPTMGALHDGHLSLVRAAVGQCDEVVLTIFVNPLQFAAGEDLSAYPRPIERDLAMADAAGVDVVFTPSTAEMYPPGASTTVRVAGLTETLEGTSRPTHFDGVTTIVAKLFALTGPCRAYFGEKDFQQLAVVKRMATDLEMPIVVVGCPIVREPDGLAMSSRNVHLTPAQRSAARVLSIALRAGVSLVRSGEQNGSAVVDAMTATVSEEPEARLDYAAAVDPSTLEPVDRLVPGTAPRLLVAARFGTTRLLDNLSVVVP